MRSCLRLTAVVCISLAACDDRRVRPEPIRVLFVGSSDTYEGNLPEVFDALSTAHGRVTSSDVVNTSEGLKNHVNDGSFDAALGDRMYAAAILHSRGGESACRLGTQVCVTASENLKALAEVAKSRQAKALLLGGYGTATDASEGTEEAEALIAGTSGVEYIAVADRLEQILGSLPDMSWHAADGKRPGPDAILVEALLLFERIHGVKPNRANGPLSVVIDMVPYSPDATDPPIRHEYEAARLNAILNELW